MAFIKEECEVFEIEEVFTVKNEVTEEQTDLMPLKEESEVEEKNPTGEKPFACQKCGRRFRSKLNFKRHMRIHTEEEFVCDQGGKSFQCKVSLEIHMNEKSFACGKSFPDTKEKFISPEHQSFSNKGIPMSHVKTHIRAKAYECHVCGMSFRYYKALKTHIRVHDEDKRFACSRCGRRFANKKRLKCHSRIHSRKKLQCTECDRICRNENHLRNHLRIHSRIRPHSCDQCDKTFIFRAHLKTHKKSHVDVKPYLCPKCGKAFKRLGNFKRHQEMRICEKAKQNRLRNDQMNGLC